MRVYLISTAKLTSAQINKKYLKNAQEEECFYQECIPTAYIAEPEKYGWPKEVTELFKNSVEVYKEEVGNLYGQQVSWTKFDYKSVRYFLEIESIKQLESLLSTFGGNIRFHQRGLENSSRLFKEGECESFLGMPDIGDAIILEIEDDKIEEILEEMGRGI